MGRLASAGSAAILSPNVHPHGTAGHGRLTWVNLIGVRIAIPHTYRFLPEVACLKRSKTAISSGNFALAFGLPTRFAS